MERFRTRCAASVGHYRKHIRHGKSSCDGVGREPSGSGLPQRPPRVRQGEPLPDGSEARFGDGRWRQQRDSRFRDEPTPVVARGVSKVRQELFKVWLGTARELSAGTVRSRISNCMRVEHHEGDLDVLYDSDGLAGLIDRLNPKKPKHKVPINGNIYNGTATLKTAVGLYRDFRDSGGGKADLTEAPSKRYPQVRRTRSALPDDLRLIELKYSWNCEACGTQLPIGRQAYWSPKARGRVWCLKCPTQNAAVPNHDFRDAVRRDNQPETSASTRMRRGKAAARNGGWRSPGIYVVAIAIVILIIVTL